MEVLELRPRRREGLCLVASELTSRWWNDRCFGMLEPTSCCGGKKLRSPGVGGACGVSIAPRLELGDNVGDIEWTRVRVGPRKTVSLVKLAAER